MEVGEARGWIDLKTVPDAIRGTTQVNASHWQSHHTGHGLATLSNLFGQLGGNNAGREPLAARIAVIISTRHNLTREHLRPHHMDTPVPTRHILLPLRWAPHDVCQAFPVRRREPGYNAAYPTY